MLRRSPHLRPAASANLEDRSNSLPEIGFLEPRTRTPPPPPILPRLELEFRRLLSRISVELPPSLRFGRHDVRTHLVETRNAGGLRGFFEGGRSSADDISTSAARGQIFDLHRSIAKSCCRKRIARRCSEKIKTNARSHSKMAPLSFFGTLETF